MLRSLFHFLLRLLFRFRAFGVESLKTPGPVLLVPNHVSWLDFLFLWVLLEKDWKFVVSSVAAQYSWLHRKIMLNRRTFPIDPASPYAVRRLAEHLAKNGRLVLFAEGRITYTGTLMKLFDGTGFLLHKTPARVVTCYLRGANRLRWSRQPGWRRWWPRVTAHFSPALEPPRLEHVSTAQARAKLTTWLRDTMVRQQFDVEMESGPATLPEAIVEAAVAQPTKAIVQDATLQELPYRRLLVGAELLGGKLAARVGREQERVGVLLPNVNAMPVVLLGLWAHGKVPAILNFSLGPASMLACARLAGLKQVITSRTFVERARLKLDAFTEAGIALIHLEDVRGEIAGWEKLVAAARLRWNPRHLNRRDKFVLHMQHETVRAIPGSNERVARTARRPSPIANPLSTRPAVVLFTSGSEGAPKGVELTHANLLANIRQMLAVIDVVDDDRIFNALPTFHSFGLTVGLLLGLVRGLHVFLYPSPLHYRLVPNVLYDRACTIFLGTNTFLNGYARKAHPYDFRTLRYLFAGAEKVQDETARVWAQRFGVRILEGYGATECSPVISVNVPMAPKHGTAGRLLPGMELKLEPVEGISEMTNVECGMPNAGGGGPEPKSEIRNPKSEVRSPKPTTGRLLVRGPNVMRGYLNADANAAFQSLGGWYDTGDIVSVDDDGFITIRGRLKRFAKVSGEMVSLTAVEDALAGAFPQYGQRCEVAIVARPDEDKGEALVAIANDARLTLEEIRAAIRAKGLPNLCVPREVKFLREIPKLGTGKVNHRELAAWLEKAP